MHESEIEVTVNQDGSVTYVVTSESAETAEDMQALLESETLTETLNTGLSEDFADVAVTSVTVSEAVTADVVVTVDTTDASNNLNTASTNLVDALTNAGYEASAESNSFSFFDCFGETFTLQPPLRSYQACHLP